MKVNIKRFYASNANSTTLSSSAGNKATLAVSFTENSTNTTNNTSNVTISGSLTMTSGNFSVSSSPTLTIYWHDNHNNTDVYVNSKVIQALSRGNSDSTSGTIDVTHNNDGTLSGYAFATWTYSGSTTYVPAGGSVGTPLTALTNIPRASTVSATTANIGSNSTITITRAVETFTHTLTYSFNNGAVTGTIATKTSNTSVSFTLPTSLYAQIPNANSITGTITCTTYSGDTVIGSSPCNITANVPTSAIPTIAVPAIEDTDSVSKNTIGVYVQGKSKLKFTFTGKASSNYGATIVSYTLKINGTQVFNDNLASYTMQTALPNTSNTYEFIATDSRGKTATTGSKTITAYAYSAPTCSISAERNSTTPSTVNITYSGAITNINSNNNNAKSFTIQYRQAGSTGNWTTVTGFPVTNAYTKSNISVSAANVSDSNTFDFKITATDSYGSATATVQVPTSATLINFSADGTALALGKASETASTFEVDLKSKFTKEVNLPAIANVKSNGTALTTTIQNAIQSSIITAGLNTGFPVGTIITTTTNTNPSSTYGGTWVSVVNNDILESGTLTDSDLSYGEYRIYANGDIEAWGYLNSINVNAGSQNNYSITLPYSVISANVVSGLAYGGSNWPWSNVYTYCAGGGNTITLSIFATGGLIQSMQPNFYLKGTINLSNNNIATHYSWKRTA